MVKGHWRPALSTGEMGGATVKQQGGGLIPIPTLTQCLDWLRKWAIEHDLELPDLMADDYFNHGVAEYTWTCQWGPDGVSDWTKAQTATEAAYLAMIKILGGEE